MDFFVYVLKSEIDGRLYKGQTSDIQKRPLKYFFSNKLSAF
jgi:putative endonuclease